MTMKQDIQAARDKLRAAGLVANVSESSPTLLRVHDGNTTVTYVHYLDVDTFLTPVTCKHDALLGNLCLRCETRISGDVLKTAELTNAIREYQDAEGNDDDDDTPYSEDYAGRPRAE